MNVVWPAMDWAIREWTIVAAIAANALVGVVVLSIADPDGHWADWRGSESSLVRKVFVLECWPAAIILMLLAAVAGDPEDPDANDR